MTVRLGGPRIDKEVENGTLRPFGSVDAVENEMRLLCDEGKMTVSHAYEVSTRLFKAAHGDAS